MGLNSYSDYGSGSSSSEQYSPWGSPDTWSPFKTRFEEEPPLRSRSSSFIEGQAKGLDAVMQEFRMNGSDSPYDPEEDKLYYRKALTGMGPSSAYLRQKSWPAPESTPAVGLPPQEWAPSAAEILLASSRVTEVPKPEPAVEEMITEQQMRVLRSLPNAVLYPLLRQLGHSWQRAGKQEEVEFRVCGNNGEREALFHRAASIQEVECRFCKNNGERPAYYRSHALRVAGRVTCPVLRAFVCRRCGARGDSAHTFKYCPLTPADERTKSAAMMRSVRMASGRRRLAPSSETQDFVVFGETTPSVIADGSSYNHETLPLDPIWAALEKKLML